MGYFYDDALKVLACLLTHSAWTKRIVDNPLLLVNHFRLTRKSYQNLKRMLGQYGARLYLAAQLAEEKRWREVVPVLKYTIKIFKLDDLEQYWRNYIDSYSLTKPIPANPLLESIAYLDYLHAQEMPEFTRQVIDYEGTKNVVLAYEVTRVADSMQCFSNHDFSSRWRIKINPSLIIKSYTFALDKLVKQWSVQDGSRVDQASKMLAENLHFTKKCTIAFFKSMRSGRVKILLLTAEISQLILLVKQYGKVADVLCYLNNYSDNAQSSYKTQLLKLCELELFY